MPTTEQSPTFGSYMWVTEDAEIRARRGASLLDGEKPDWFYDIEPRTLNVNDVHNCVLHQVYGSYAAGMAVLAVYPFSYGFSGDIGELREAWIQQAALRLAMASPSPRPARWYRRMWETVTA